MHAGAIEKNGAMVMAAVCDIDPERRKLASERFGCPVYEDYHEMLNAEQLDLVCVVTRSDQHCAMTCDCLDAGVSVLVTKPWAVSASEAQRMISHARRSAGKLLPWLPARWGYDLRRLKELVDGGDIGRPFMVRRIVSSFATRSDWQTERRCGGGYLLNWGAHIVDPPALLVSGKVKSVFGRMKQTINPGDVEDLFMAVMILDNGVIVQAEYTISTEKLPSWVVQGDRGTIVVNGNQVRIHTCVPSRPDDPTRFTTMQADGEDVIEETLGGSQYGEEHEIYALIAAEMLGEGSYPVAPEDALELSRVLDAIRKSSEEDRVVNL